MFTDPITCSVAYWAAETLKVEEAGSFETQVNIYRSARRHIPGNLTLQPHRCENTQTSHNLITFWRRRDDPRHWWLSVQKVAVWLWI